MLKVEKVDVHGWLSAIRGMRNPMNSWDKSDSHYSYVRASGSKFYIGDNDMALMRKLVKAGTDHSKFMRMLHISMDITAPMYWWKEFDTYRVGVCPNPTDIEYNSTSTMHKIAAKEFTIADFSCEHLFGVGDVPYDRDSEAFSAMETDINNGVWAPSDVLDITIHSLNFYRNLYLETDDKRYWWQLIQQLPSSYNYLRTVDFNYQAARHMYQSRRAHKLDEWHGLCDALASLPYAKELIIE